jgi:peptidoglycan recognition protein
MNNKHSLNGNMISIIHRTFHQTSCQIDLNFDFKKPSAYRIDNFCERSKWTLCQHPNTITIWGVRSANPPVLQKQPPNSFVVHHTAGNCCLTQAACDQQMRNIQSWQMDGNGWSDIGYNFCIGDTAVIYEGRGWNRQGAHSPGFSSRSIGFCFMGAFNTVLPPAAALNTAQAFVICARDWGRLTTTYRLLGHRQYVLVICFSIT